MPLSAPCLESEEVLGTCSLIHISTRFRALRFLIGDSSQPKPLDQTKLLSPPVWWFVFVQGREQETYG